jgi:dTDP-4-dehydrorhamnose reductase
VKIAIIGSNGQLGTDVGRAFELNGDDVCTLTHADIEVSNYESVLGILAAMKPAVVVNTSAMHNVERCEQEPGSAFAINALGPRNVAQVTRDLGATVIHVSTDYVFDGGKGEPYIETDAPAPLNAYGNTKLAGECFVRSGNPKHFVLRTSALYGKQPCRGKGGLNFVELMLKLARERGAVRVVNNEVVSPTSTAELAKQIVSMTQCDAYGLYHATAEGSCSWFEFAREIFDVSDIKVKLEAASPGEFQAKVPRPCYSVLENKRLKKLGLNVFRDWRESVSEYVGAERGKSDPVIASL